MRAWFSALAGENLALACVGESEFGFSVGVQRKSLALTGVRRSWILQIVRLKFLSFISDPLILLRPYLKDFIDEPTDFI